MKSRTLAHIFLMPLVVAGLFFFFSPISTTASSNISMASDENFHKNLDSKSRSAVVLISAEINVLPEEDETESPMGISPDPDFIHAVYTKTFINKDFKVVQQFNTGTGFIISHDGFILTNYHIIKSYKSVRVRLSDGRVFPADVIKYQDREDIAFLKIRTDSPASFPSLALGNSFTAERADRIIVIGHPFRLDWTLSVGTISGLGRMVSVHPSGLIQVQSSINPGNSGSPLINSRGEVIGIIQSMPINSSGIGFAIPINFVIDAMPFLKNVNKQR